MSYPDLPPGTRAQPQLQAQVPLVNTFEPMVQQVPAGPSTAGAVQQAVASTSGEDKSTWDNIKEGQYSVLALTVIAILVIMVLAYFFYKWYEDNKVRKGPRSPPKTEGPKNMTVKDRISRDTKGYYPADKPADKKEAPPPVVHPPHPTNVNPDEFESDEDETPGEVVKEKQPAETTDETNEIFNRMKKTDEEVEEKTKTKSTDDTPKKLGELITVAE